MASEYAKIRLSIWADSDFTRLSKDAQWLYFVLLSMPGRSWAGVTDWRPNRLLQRAGALTVADFTVAAEELQQALFVIVDDDTEEALIRTFIKHDELLRNKNLAAAAYKAFRQITSNTLRGVIVHEMRKLYGEQPELPGWDTIGKILELEAIDPAELTPPEQYSEDYPEAP